MECIFSNVFRGGDFLRILTVLSDLMVPLLIFYVVGLGLLMKQDVFGDFLNGAKDGMRTVIGIVPTLIGLMAAVGVLRSSGFLEDFGNLLGTVLEPTGIPSALVPLSVGASVFQQRGGEPFAGSLQGGGLRLLCWTGSFHYHVVYRDRFLYDDGLLWCGSDQKNAVYSGWRLVFFSCWNDSRCFACTVDLTIFSDHTSEMC